MSADQVFPGAPLKALVGEMVNQGVGIPQSSGGASVGGMQISHNNTSCPDLHGGHRQAEAIARGISSHMHDAAASQDSSQISSYVQQMPPSFGVNGYQPSSYLNRPDVMTGYNPAGLLNGPFNSQIASHMNSMSSTSSVGNPLQFISQSQTNQQPQSGIQTQPQSQMLPLFLPPSTQSQMANSQPQAIVVPMAPLGSLQLGGNGTLHQQQMPGSIQGQMMSIPMGNMTSGQGNGTTIGLGPTIGQNGQLPQQHQQQQQQQQQMVTIHGPPRTQSKSVITVNGSRKDWHSPNDGDANHRKTMTDRIIHLLQQRKPNANPDWQDKLPHMAKRLEDALYCQASSLQEYLEPTTLKNRLQQLALQMGGAKQQSAAKNEQRHNVHQQQQPFASQQSQHQYVMQQNQQQSLSASHMRTAQAAAAQYPNQMMNSTGHHQIGQPLNSMSSMNGLTSMGGMGGSMGYPNSISTGLNFAMNMSGTAQPDGSSSGSPVAQGMNGQMSTSQAIHSVVPNDSGDILGGVHGHSTFPHNVMGPDVQPSRHMLMSQINPLVAHNSLPPHQSGSHGTQMAYGSIVGAAAPQQTHPQQQALQQPRTLVAGGGVGSIHLGHSQTPPHSDEHRNQVLRQQQQRLLLLRHASKCPHDSGSCTVTTHCASMKTLWKHIMCCKDQECKVPHCVSSRYVLSHYSKCKDSNCPVCKPVREAIRRNYEKGKEVIKEGRKTNPEVFPSRADMAPMRQIDSRVDDAPPPYKRVKSGVRDDNVQTVPHPKASEPQKRIQQLDPVSSAIYCFTDEQIKAHVGGIHEGMKMTATKVKEMCLPVLDDVLKLNYAASVFGAPVDPVLLNLPDYFDIVKSPMDLGTVRKRLESLAYRDISAFAADVHLCFDNAMLYNPKQSQFHLLAKQYKNEFDKKYRQKIKEYKDKIEENKKDVNTCPVCGEAELLYEPPVYYCNGRCGQRIRRGANYFQTPNNNHHWCTSCFNGLPDGQIRVGENMVGDKAELAQTKTKHTKEDQESWVMCDGINGDPCGRWVHIICGLFNQRRNIGDIKYTCPSCFMKSRASNSTEGVVATLTSKTKAIDLPLNNMIMFMEKRISERLELAYAETAERTGVNIEDVERCPQLVLRQVSCIDKMQPTREGICERYKHRNYPSEFPCRTKCVVLFQNIDGQDVILFGMYVYEYGDKCPAPNTRRVYISYLDSVHYFRPKQYRTIVYHEILISYLDYVKKRGFHTAHIWSCPPSKGDDYILYCHPGDQKTPKTEKLQKWYADMLEVCKARGIVTEITDLHTEFLNDASNDATVLPYFEGDYWTTEAEVIIKSFREGGNTDDEPDDANDSKSKSKRKSKLSRPSRAASRGTSFGRSERDPVMTKLANIIEPMKNTFFVARLHPPEHVKTFFSQTSENVNEDSIGEDIEVVGIPHSSESMKVALDCEPVRTKEKGVWVEVEPVTALVSDDVSHVAPTTYPPEFEIQDRCESATACDVDNITDKHDVKREKIDDMSVAEAKDDGKKDDIWHMKRGKHGEAVEESPPNTSTAEAKQKDPNGDIDKALSHRVKYEVEKAPSVVSGSSDGANLSWESCIKDDTEDLDDTQESEHWDTRQSFLNLCQGNHYQFDQLRRAKHTSMMVLYHMHNPDAPKFVPSCQTCNKDIVAGAKFYCEPCDVNYCEDCYTASSGGPSIHQHPLQRKSAGGSQVQQLTEQERKDRHRNMQLHLQLLIHAAYCVDTCKNKNCIKMKEFFKHMESCQKAAKGTCMNCKRLHSIMQMHARSCRESDCRVLNCVKIREQHREMAIRQQQMDDRRRAMINQMYHNPEQHNVPSKATEGDQDDT